MLICPNRVAQLCYDFYSQKIPSKNKPVANQWTTLAAILMTSNNCKGYLNTYRSTWLLKLKNFICFFYCIEDQTELQILCLTTGTKCLSEKQLPVDGSLVHDSHAEVLARRCFIRFGKNHQFKKRCLSKVRTLIFYFLTVKNSFKRCYGF
jgi:hypothetical protein